MQLILSIGLTFLETFFLNITAILITLTIFIIGRSGGSTLKLRQKTILKKPFLLLLTLFTVFYSSSIILWSQSLDTDSFIEVQGFDVKEAAHFIKSVPSIFHTPGQTRVINNIHILLIWFLLNSFSKGLVKTDRRKNISKSISVMALVAFVGYQSWSLLQRFDSRPALLVQVEENFTAPQEVRAQSLQTSPLTVVTYIGESTSRMNMSLYGYFRNTTPALNALSEQPGFIKFNHVYSTHTHTTPSLLQALSVQRPAENNSFDIFEDKRLSVTQLLNQAGINTSWISNQTDKGAWNQASKIFSGHSNDAIFSTNNAIAGNYDHNLKRPFDHEFFQSQLKKLPLTSRQAIFLHSYAGHGPYLQFIPDEFQKPVDDQISGLSKSSLLGRGLIIFGDFRQSIQTYDSALRYIDYSVTQSMKIAIEIKKEEPVVFIYFADHGESVYTARGHDSSRLIYEMVAVPFIVYFNQAAQKKYPEKYAAVQLMAKDKSYSLDLLTPLINYLFDIQVWDNNKIVIDIQSKIDKISPYLVYRSGVNSAIKYNIKAKHAESLKLKKDSTIELEKMQVAVKAKGANSKVCLHRSNSIAIIVRGLSASNCIEADIVVDGDNIDVNHPPASSVGLDFDLLLSMVNKSKGSIWLDAKNINTPQNCQILSNKLRDYKYLNKVLVEFPSNTAFDDKGIQQCLESLHQQGFKTSYYVPTTQAKRCLKLQKEHVSMANKDCQSLKVSTLAAIAAGVQQVSFESEVYPLIQQMPELNNVTKNTWFMNFTSYEVINQLIENDDFNMIILTSKDTPNKN